MTDPTPITDFRIDYHLSATVTVNGDSWLKPGVSAGMSWKSVPSEEQIAACTKFLTKQVVEPVIEEVLVTMHSKIDKYDEAKRKI